MTVATYVLCCCDARRDAQLEGELIFLPSRNAWALVNAPLRRMSDKARYFAFAERKEHAHHDYTGHVYEFYCCPFCGHSLPYTQDGPADQADGWREMGEGEE